jgi:hypothetical protein
MLSMLGSDVINEPWYTILLAAGAGLSLVGVVLLVLGLVSKVKG